jgi:DNA-binding transcriptional LysR family regulator
MTIIQMEIFLKVIEAKSFTKAGEDLGLSQSAVSHAIANLEESLGFQLVVRNRSGASVTSNGEKMIPHFRNILNQMKLMKQEADEITGLQKGKISIGTFESITINWLPHILKQFNDQHPQVEIELLEGTYEEICHWLQIGKIDVGFILNKDKLTVDFYPLKDDRLKLLLPSSHELREHQSISMTQLISDPFIMPYKGCDEHVRLLFKQQNVLPNVKFVIKDVHSIVAMVQAGLGISIMPELTLPNQMDHIYIKHISDDVYRTIGIAALDFKRLSPAAERFIEITKTWISQKNKYFSEGKVAGVTGEEAINAEM